MKNIFLAVAICSLLFCGGCISLWTKTIFVPDGQAVRIREKVYDAKVWVMTETGEIVPGTMDLPQGWYCLPKED